MEENTLPDRVVIKDKRFYPRNNDYYVGVTTVLEMSPKGPELIKWIADNGYAESQRIMNLKAKKGSIVHSGIEALLKGEELQSEDYELDEWEALASFVLFAEKYKLKPIALESVVYNDEYKYAGTVDFYGAATLPGKTTPIIVRIDFKTSNYLWVEYDYQLAAYEKAAVSMGELPADELMVVKLGAKNKQKFSVHTVKDRESNFAYFALLLQLFYKKNKDLVPRHKSIPKTLQYNITLND